MINWIRNFLLNRILKKASDRKYLGWEKTKSILLLVDAKTNEDQPHVLELKNSFEKAGKTIFLLTFVAAKKPKEGAKALHYYKNDVTLFGQAKSRIKQLINDDFDVVIYWANKENSPNVFLTAEANASFKVGISSMLSFFDLTIADYDLNHHKTSEEIIKFLKLINHE